MIEAEKDPFFDSVLYLYTRWTLRRHFHSIQVAGLDHLKNLEKYKATIAFANHTNWWDGLVIFYLTRFQPRKSFYRMMEEKQLSQYRFFTKVGAFSVDPENRLRAAGTVLYSLELLKDYNNLLWIFPQGRLASSYEPVEVRPGAGFIARRKHDAQMLPLAMRYEFVREQKPQIFLRFGAPFPAGEAEDEKIGGVLRDLCSRLEEDCRTRTWQDYDYLMSPGLSVNKAWDYFRKLLRGKLSEFTPAN